MSAEENNSKSSNNNGQAPYWMVEGAGNQQPVMTQNTLQQAQAHVDDVVGIMRENVDKLLVRGKNLSELHDRADILVKNASMFERQAEKVQRKFWWEDIKMMVVMGVIGLIFLMIIIWWVTSGTGGSNDPTSEIVYAAREAGREVAKEEIEKFIHRTEIISSLERNNPIGMVT